MDSPKKVTLLLSALPDPGEASSFENFVGSQTAEVTEEVILKCLYTKNEADYDESFVGYENVISGTLYLSPKQLTKAVGTFRLDGRTVKFIMDGREYNTLGVELMEELYGTCVAVAFKLKDKLRG